MEELLQYDFIKEEIFGKLTPLGLYNMKLSNKRLNNYITLSIVKNSVIREIDTRLSLIFGDKYDDLNKILDETKAVISGSFIIQCILGEYWENSDIDIYFPIINNKEYSNDHGNPYYELERFLYEDVKFKLKDSYSAVNRYQRDLSKDKVRIKYIRNYGTLTNDIQVIQAEIKKDRYKMNKFINGTFDFDICKNTYHINNGKQNLNILKLYDILNKIAEFKIASRVGSSLERYEKYTKRGFNIINNMTYEEIANKATKCNHVREPSDLYNGIIYLFHMKKIGDNEYQVKSRDIGKHEYAIYHQCDCILRKVGKNYIIIPKQEICHDKCLMRFCKSEQKHLCYNTTNGQYIFVIDE